MPSKWRGLRGLVVLVDEGVPLGFERRLALLVREEGRVHGRVLAYQEAPATKTPFERKNKLDTFQNALKTS